LVAAESKMSAVAGLNGYKGTLSSRVDGALGISSNTSTSEYSSGRETNRGRSPMDCDIRNVIGRKNPQLYE